jgi:Protein of unknown function (DUF3383)
MSVNQFVTFTINVNNAGLSLPGFGTPLIVSYGATFPELVRTYSQYADVLVDFPAGTPEADAADQLFSQSPHPQQVKIGRATLKPTLQYQVGAIQVSNNYKYVVQVDGPGITSTPAFYTSDSTATTQEIHNGLVAALNAVVGKNYTATFAPLTFVAFNFTTNHAVSNTNLLATGHGLNTGDGPIELTNSGGALPTGFSTLTDYWVIRVDANTLQIATSLANALAGTAVTFSADGTGTQTINPDTTLSPVLPFLVTGSAAGNWFSIDTQPNATTQAPRILSNKMTHSDPGIATDLAALALADTGWYWLVTSGWNSKAFGLGAAGWVEANGKAYVVATCDTDSVNTAVGNLDLLDSLNNLSYKRTSGWYHNSPLEMLDAALTGVLAPANPGSWTAAFKTLVGAEPNALDGTERTNIKARNSGAYTQELGKDITWDGKVFNTTYGYLDITVGIDWFSTQVVGAAFGAMTSVPKVAYTDEDIDFIAGAVKGVIHQATSDANPVLDPGDPTDPANQPPDIVFPKVADVSPGTRALRKLPNGVINGRLQGAVQEIDFLATLTF